MALEALLPSEIARLVYGYLIQEKCTETAKIFIDESPNLQECRNVLTLGKHFTTRVCGYALLDILEKFCIINSIVQEKINKFDDTDKLRYFNDLINQVKFLVEQYKGQQKTINIDILKSQSIIGTESFSKTYRRYSASNIVEDNLHKTEQTLNKDVTSQVQANIHLTKDSTTVDATQLENLPGYIKELQNEKYETSKFKFSEKMKEPLKIENNLQKQNIDENNYLQKIQNENQYLFNHKQNILNKNITPIATEENIKKYTSCGVQTSEKWCNILEKSTMSNTSKKKIKSNKSYEIQCLKISSSNLKSSTTNECIELLSNLSLELINRTEIQERIADNINKILEPIKSILFNKSNEEDLNKSFITEFNKAIEVAINNTENDPEFLELVNEIIPENKEILNIEDKIEINNKSMDYLKEKSMLSSKENISKNNIDKVTEFEKLNRSIPLISDEETSNKIINVDSVYLSKNENNFDNLSTFKQIDSTTKNINKIPMSNTFISNTMNLLNPLESPVLQKKTSQKYNNLFSYNNVTSTPIKTNTIMQNLDTYTWVSTQDLLKTNIIHKQESITIPLKTNTCIIYETPANTRASHLSPIISKERTEVAERIADISCSFTNKIIDQSLKTPDVFSPKINVSSNIQSTFSSIENTNNLSPLLKDNGYNKYFSLESIMLYGMDNNISTVKSPIIVPEIEVDDSITLTGTGLSPFLKIHKKSDIDNICEKNNVEEIKSIINKKNYESEGLIEKNNDKIAEVLISKKVNDFESIIEKNNIEFLKNTSNQTAIKHTPVKLLENQYTNSQLSLSTSKKPNNYIRALNFNAPVNKSYSESKLKDKEYCLSSEMTKQNLKNSCKTLFQSPPFTNSDIIEAEQSSNAFRTGVLDVTNLISLSKTRHKMNEIYKKEEKNFNKISKKVSTLKKKNCTKLFDKNKNTWDSDLRKYLGEMENKNDSKKHKPKKNIKEKLNKHKILTKNKVNEKTMKINKFKTKCTSKKIDLKKKFNNSNSIGKIKFDKTVVETKLSKNKVLETTTDLIEILSNSINKDKIVNEEDILELASQEMNNLNAINENKSHDNNEKIMITLFKAVAENLPDKIISNNKINVSHPKNNSLMDYENIEQQLSIITNTNIKNNFTNKIEVIYDRVSKVECGKIVQKKYARLKTLDTNITKSSFASNKQLSDFALELETPQKNENSLEVPPTPRILSPGSSSLLMPISKLTEDSRTIQSFMATPLECPLTPKIILTPPKPLDNSTSDSQAKNLPYYQVPLNTFKPSNKLEITQFEVIKENLRNNKQLKNQFDNKIIDDGTEKLNAPMLYREKKVNSKSESSSSFLSSLLSSCTCNNCLSSSSDNQNNISEDKQNNDNEDVQIKVGKTITKNTETSLAKLFVTNTFEKKIENYTKEISSKNKNIDELTIFEASNISLINDIPMNLDKRNADTVLLEEEKTNKIEKLNEKLIGNDILSVSKSSTNLLKPLQSNIQINTSEIQNKTNSHATIQKKKIEINIEGVTNAVKSILVAENENINNNKKDTTLENIIFNLSFENKNYMNKIELMNSIESTINTECEVQQLTLLEEKNSNVRNSRETNIKFILNKNALSKTLSDKTKQRLAENCNVNIHQHNTRFKSRQIMNNDKKVFLSENISLSNENISCQEIQYIFNEDNYKRKRRKTFNETDLICEFRNEFGDPITIITPTILDTIFQINPIRKKSLKKRKNDKKDQFVFSEFITENSISNNSNNILSLNSKTVINDKKANRINNKRKCAVENDVFMKRKRKKNMFL